MRQLAAFEPLLQKLPILFFSIDSGPVQLHIHLWFPHRQEDETADDGDERKKQTYRRHNFPHWYYSHTAEFKPI
jgi:hypothetical protein